MAEIKISWVNLEDEQYAVARWVQTGQLINEFTDYSIYLTRDKSSSHLTLETALFHLTRLFVFLKNNKLKLDEFNDIDFRRFRREEFDRLRKKTGMEGSEKVQKRTINARVKRIYKFFLWYQEVAFGGECLIGPSGCNIRSELATVNLPYKMNASAFYLFPLLYKLTGARSKHRPVQRATESVKAALVRQFSGATSEYLASRNILILDIADEVGLRRGSINSLTCAEFKDSLERNDGLEDTVVVPRSQKFGYQVPYTFSFRLVASICNYIEGPRKQLLEGLKLPERIGEDRLFVSSKSGKPLTDHSITDIVASSLRKAGVKHGAIHIFRHKFINDEVEREILRRVKLKLDTSIDSIAAAVALKVGQANPHSLYTYISDAQQRMRVEVPEDNASKIAAIQKEIEALESQLKILRGLV